jgi:hypothetical protein
MNTLTNSQARAALRDSPHRLLDAESSEARAEILHRGVWLRLGRTDREGKYETVINFSTDPLFYRDPVEYHRRLMKFGAKVTDSHFFVVTE